MAQDKKYATLPDLDSAPDIYETPDRDGDDDVDSRSIDPGPTEQPLERGDQSLSSIDHHQLHLDQARNRFASSRLDARDVDFSDRANGIYKSYRSGHARRSKNGTLLEVYGGESDGDEETLDARLSRLRREFEEVRAEMQSSPGRPEDVLISDGRDLNDVKEMALVLQKMQLGRSRVSQNLITGSPLRSIDCSENIDDVAGPLAQYLDGLNGSRPDALAIDAKRLLAKAADIDSRLAALEANLGTLAPRVDNVGDHRGRKGVVSSLESIENKLSTIIAVSVPSLEMMAQKIHQMTQTADRLRQTRNDAREARSIPSARSPGVRLDSSVHLGQNGSNFDVDYEQDIKVDTLYRTISTVESLSPLLPAVLDRLKSLRLVHADAANAGDNLDALEKRQAEAAEDIRQWRIGLEKIEKAMEDGNSASTNNAATAQAWVKDLEARVQKLT